MITEEDVQHYIERIPPSPAILKQTLSFVNEGELTKAASEAEGDMALQAYLKKLVNRPIYGFRTEVSDIHQIFGILGINGAQQVLYNYMLSLLSPSKWELFHLDAVSFQDLQAHLSRKWHKILTHLSIDNKDIESAITLLPASIIICEALFKSKQDEVNLLRTTSSLDYNTILKRLSGKDLFEICETIALTWEMPPVVINIIHSASGLHPDEDPAIDSLGQWMHLLLFYELSNSTSIEAGLNDFIDFQVEYVADIYEPFMALMEIE
ncbi:MAG: HDOD domain-containing protein [Campylobacterota bacterium]|nr:HDOD domain-containing protein [Campylobacterota bacterium]